MRILFSHVIRFDGQNFLNIIFITMKKAPY